MWLLDVVKLFGMLSFLEWVLELLGRLFGNE